jgi:hypothetical protein
MFAQIGWAPRHVAHRQLIFADPARCDDAAKTSQSNVGQLHATNMKFAACRQALSFTLPSCDPRGDQFRPLSTSLFLPIHGIMPRSLAPTSSI